MSLMSAEKKIPDYTEIVRLENLARDNYINLYAEEYNRLAKQYGASTVNDCLEQVQRGSW